MQFSNALARAKWLQRRPRRRRVEILPGPLKKCKLCELYMRRVYVQQGETVDGKRKNKWIAIGHAYLNCKVVEFESPEERL